MKFKVDMAQLEELARKVGSLGDAEDVILQGAAKGVGDAFIAADRDVPHRTGELEGSRFTRIEGKIIESGFTSRHMSRKAQRQQIMPRAAVLAEGATKGGTEVLERLVGEL